MLERETWYFNEFGNAMLMIFAMALGDFDIDFFYESKSEWILVFLFVMYMILMHIILINLLIAIMSNTYSQIQAKEELSFYIGRGKLIRDIELKLIPRIINNIKYFYIL